MRNYLNYDNYGGGVGVTCGAVSNELYCVTGLLQEERLNTRRGTADNFPNQNKQELKQEIEVQQPPIKKKKPKKQDKYKSHIHQVYCTSYKDQMTVLVLCREE